MRTARPQMSARARDERGGTFAADGQSSCPEEDGSQEYATPGKARHISQDGGLSAMCDIEEEGLMELDLLSTEDGRRSHARNKSCEFPGQERPPIQKRSMYDLTIVNLSYKVGQQTALSHAYFVPRKMNMRFVKSIDLPLLSADLIP